MSDGTHIEWTDATWNPITGCSVYSAGCTNCYAMKLAGTRLRNHPSRAGLTITTKAGPVWNGKVRFNEQWLDQPMRWSRPRKVFVCAHSDLFHESVPDEWIDQIFAVMGASVQHSFQVLTKRATRMRAYMTTPGVAERWYRAGSRWGEGMDEWPFGIGNAPCYPGLVAPALPHVWLGVSVENQAAADERIPHLLQTPAAVRWISAEPLLGPVDLKHIALSGSSLRTMLPLAGLTWTTTATGTRCTEAHAKLDWVVAGGESGAGARPMHPDWARSIRDGCAEAGVPFLFKQWGEHVAIYDRDRDDPDWRQCNSVVLKHPDGRWLNLEGGHGFHGDRIQFVVPVGKKLAGRELDGKLHDGYPA